MVSPPFMFGPGISEIFTITQLAIIAFAILLAAITINAHKTTGLKRLKYIIAAFGLFAFNHIINLIDAKFADIIPDDVRFSIVSCGTLGILILIFLGIIRK